MKFTAGKAAKAVGVSTPTITKAIKSGELKADPNPKGPGWLIDGSELARAYPDIQFDPKGNVKHLEKVTPPMDAALQAQIDGLRELVRAHEATISDLRDDRDEWKEQAKRSTLMLANHQEKAPETSAGNEAVKRGLIARLLGRTA